MLDDKDEFAREDDHWLASSTVSIVVFGSIVVMVCLFVGMARTVNKAHETARAIVDAQHLNNQKALDTVYRKAQQIIAEAEDAGR